MKLRLILAACACAFALAGCSQKQKPSGNNNTPAAPTPAASKTPGPLPDTAFKAEITLSDPPTKLRAGQKENIQVRVRNASNVFWWARGGETNDRTDNKFYI